MQYTNEIISHKKGDSLSNDSLSTTEIILKDIVRKESIEYNRQMNEIDNVIAKEVLLQSEQLALYKSVTGLLTTQKVLKDLGDSLARSVGYSTGWNSRMSNYL